MTASIITLFQAESRGRLLPPVSYLEFLIFSLCLGVSVAIFYIGDNSMTERDLQLLRASSQHLFKKSPPVETVDIVKRVVGINAQLEPAMLLGLRARNGSLEIDAVSAAIKEGALEIAWSARGTLHLHANEDVVWLVRLLGTVFEAKNRGRRIALGLDDARASLGLLKIKEILVDRGEVVRDELVSELNQKGFSIERKSQAPAHLVFLAALRGIIVLGIDHESETQTYHLSKASQATEQRETLLARLASRYLDGFAPATQRDFAAWSGLTLSDAKTAWGLLADKDEILEVEVEGKIYSIKKDLFVSIPIKSDSPSVRLLPAFDDYVLGYADRSLVVPDRNKHAIYHGGQTVPALLVDGRVCGSWNYERKGKKMLIHVQPFEKLGGNVRDFVEEEARDVGMFFGAEVVVEIDR
jgi:hypothetical protein